MYLQNKKPCSCFRKQEHLEYQNFVFSWNIIFMSGINWSDWLCLNTLKAQHRVQWVATPTVLVYPLQLASRGWSSPAILPPQDWTENLTVNSPTLQPLNQVADEISCLMCLYIAQDVPGLQENSKIKNLNFVNIGIRTQYLGVVCVNTNALTAWLQAP
jgi:hypothetical protein